MSLVGFLKNGDSFNSAYKIPHVVDPCKAEQSTYRYAGQITHPEDGGFRIDEAVTGKVENITDERFSAIATTWKKLRNQCALLGSVSVLTGLASLGAGVPWIMAGTVGGAVACIL